MTNPKSGNETSGSTASRAGKHENTEIGVGARISASLGNRTPKWLAAEAGVPYSTLLDALKSGPTKVDVALRISRALGMSLDEMFGSVTAPVADPAETKTRAVPIIDVVADAGPGALNEHARTIGEMHFAETDLRRFGTFDQLRLIRSRGDSMDPEIRDDDLVMFDLSNTDSRSGIMVINRDGLLVIKRLEMLGGSRARLLSDNKAYDPVEIDLKSEQLAIVGRVVWAGKAY
jgi:phage repressor protein C with HTH and peptisase S24 domain